MYNIIVHNQIFSRKLTCRRPAQDQKLLWSTFLQPPRLGLTIKEANRSPITPRKNLIPVKSTLWTEEIIPEIEFNRLRSSTRWREFSLQSSEGGNLEKKKVVFLFLFNFFYFKVENVFFGFFFSFINSHLCRAQCERKCCVAKTLKFCHFLGNKFIKCMFIFHTELLFKAFCIQFKFVIVYFIEN